MEKEKERALEVHVLVIPLPIQGHINPMLQFSKRLASKGLRVTLVTTCSNTEAIQSQVSMVRVEPIYVGSESDHHDHGKVDNKLDWFQSILSQRLPELIQQERSTGYPISCLVYDSAMPWALDIAKSLGLSGASFFTHSCAVATVYCNVHQGVLSVPLKDPAVSLPGLPPLEPHDLPSFIYDPGSYPYFLQLVISRFSNISEADWIFFNTFDSLEKEFHGLRTQCIHIKAGMEIPDNKPLEFALPYIQGIGRARARQILSELNMENKRAKDLTKREVVALGDELSKYIVGRELTALVEKDVRRMIDIQCYRGIRHSDGLPCRGQRTKTNARTSKGGKVVPYAAKRK